MEDTKTIPFIKKSFEKLEPLGYPLHRKILNDFRKYLIVGGMPQAVYAYANTNSFEEADLQKKNILNLYRDDIGKYSGKDSLRVISIFNEIPSQLSNHHKNFKISAVEDTARSRKYTDAFLWLDKSMIVNRCFNVNDPNVGFALSADYNIQKCYLADTGLLVTMAFADDEYSDNKLFKSILLDKLNVNEGMLIENIVAQMLRANGRNLFYYYKCDTNNRANNMEVDFLLTDHKKVLPVEVKSGKYLKHSSLDKFCNKFNKRTGQPYLLYDKDLMIKDGIVCLPLYMAMFL